MKLYAYYDFKGFISYCKGLLPWQDDISADAILLACLGE